MKRTRGMQEDVMRSNEELEKRIRCRYIIYLCEKILQGETKFSLQKVYYPQTKSKKSNIDCSRHRLVKTTKKSPKFLVQEIKSSNLNLKEEDYAKYRLIKTRGRLYQEDEKDFFEGIQTTRAVVETKQVLSVIREFQRTEDLSKLSSNLNELDLYDQVLALTILARTKSDPFSVYEKQEYFEKNNPKGTKEFYKLVKRTIRYYTIF